ncbi:hypothetical protein PsyrH_20195 [Pseudomonas syringae pv. syringae HS191]|uniref:hypothetical protein n=1 Tax=Pseudomonas syringae TaxID=317 RepID=UPI00062490D8|nr:hypothetical protein [Pseudomonas syringae]AKF52772.1 hypothetical protein PsyrH_20195 [Pseudomonas syringae pv. syringae HS191]
MDTVKEVLAEVRKTNANEHSTKCDSASMMPHSHFGGGNVVIRQRKRILVSSNTIKIKHIYFTGEPSSRLMPSIVEMQVDNPQFISYLAKYRIC